MNGTNIDHGSTIEVVGGRSYGNACLVCAIVGAFARRDVIVSASLSESLIRALRPDGGTAFLMPSDDASASRTPVLDCRVLAFLLANGANELVVYVDDKYYHTFDVDREGARIAINLVNFVHWVERLSPRYESMQSTAKGISLARMLADHEAAKALMKAQVAELDEQRRTLQIIVDRKYAMRVARV
jgi:hypothetical protein